MAPTNRLKLGQSVDHTILGGHAKSHGGLSVESSVAAFERPEVSAEIVKYIGKSTPLGARVPRIVPKVSFLN